MNHRPEEFIEKAAEAYEQKLSDKSYVTYLNEQPMPVQKFTQEHIDKYKEESEAILGTKLVQNKIATLRDQALDVKKDTVTLKN